MRDKFDPPPLDHAIAAVARTQHGVISYEQLLSLGLSRSAIERRVRAGRLHPLHAGVYAVGHTRLSRNGRFMAAVLACGEGAVLSHRSAAAHWNLTREAPVRTDVTVPSRGGRKRPGITIHRTRRLPGQERTSKDGIPVTIVARTLLDLADAVPVEGAVARADRAELLDIDEVHRTIAENPGRRGTKRLLDALDAPILTRSELEEAFRALARSAGVPEPQVNTRAAGLEVDFHWPSHHLVVEADGNRYHRGLERQERDRRREAILARAGIRTHRFTHRQIVRKPSDVEATLRALFGVA